MNRFSVWGDVASVGAAASWALAVIFYKISGARVPIFALNIFKNFVAFAFYGAAFLWSGDHALPSELWEWALIAASGVLGIAVGDFCFIVGLKRLGVGLQAIVDCVYSPSVFVFAYLLYGEVLPPLTFLGGALVLSAVWVDSSSVFKRSADQKTLLSGILINALGVMVIGFSILILRHVAHQYAVSTINFFRVIFGQLALLVFMGLAGRRGEFKRGLWPGRKDAMALLPAALLTPISSLLWFAGFKYTLAGRSAIYNQMTTVFVIVLAALFLNERLTPRRVVAVGLGIAGALLVAIS